MKYKLAIFDLDGTILNTLEDLADSTNYALTKYGFPARSVAEVRDFVGNGIGKLIERAVPNGTEEDIVYEVLESFKIYYNIHCTDKTKPYDGIKSFIKYIRNEGCLTAVVSNKADFAVQELCINYFTNCFDFIVGEREGIGRKPNPDSIFEVLDKLKIKKEDSVYIGDSDIDIATAANAGIDIISVDWGFRSRDFLQDNGAVTIVSNTEQLKEEFGICPKVKR